MLKKKKKKKTKKKKRKILPVEVLKRSRRGLLLVPLHVWKPEEYVILYAGRF